MPAESLPDLEIVRVGLDHPDARLLVAAVQQVYVQRYGGTDDSPMDVGEFEDPVGAFHVGRLAGVPVVSGAWRREETPAGVAAGPCAEVKRMFVAASHQRRGLARVMLAHVEATAYAAGIRTMVLETGLRQPEAIGLYESSGYEEIPNFGFHRDEPLSRCYAKALGTTAL